MSYPTESNYTPSLGARTFLEYFSQLYAPLFLCSSLSLSLCQLHSFVGLLEDAASLPLCVQLPAGEHHAPRRLPPLRPLRRLVKAGALFRTPNYRNARFESSLEPP